ncbi:S-adenosylmethionine:tRNA ribosyltransferase-isomerase [Motilibacter peucedani]|uniref:S-adenosylmethionine:tRNA ribosyltransferase-isomerase n=1 Tax=Motilibacter peucedani TaxID=598650 RepID=A0A420XUG1_9ACTN|nr:S-adenosylmethionine:tRNA ribosyltransferase-isomerase [Motilibacter peucedani]RKS80390.1 S-adenosylmethionine:tRNA ribosyltransferase-isomerase [Motilibacter peucedani]
MTAAAPTRTRFVLPPGRLATEPPEWRGRGRDDVRLLVASRYAVVHEHFPSLREYLREGDVLVVNNSVTLPSAVAARDGSGRRFPLHVSTALDDGRWVVEARRPDQSGPDFSLSPGTRLALPGGVELVVDEPFPDAGARPSRLWSAVVSPTVDRARYLERFGSPIVYDYVTGHPPTSYYQNVWASEPGSAEMPSAGRPFTAELLVRLVSRGITVVPITLHCGVSSPELHEPPAPEPFRVSESAAAAVNSARARGGRVVAVGTTVVRALESVASPDGTVHEGAGWTDLVLSAERPARVVDGLVTGLHEPEASHLDLLDAVAGPELVDKAYEALVQGDYLWHEFGDSTLLLP